ncbi:unnamed protein product [Urochloa decumbens]|uniref:F-box domain-containing protein n=1 Tax=Urochloa decumbens TaxID=240449 RepID=A0ABC9GD74_9POAL
MGSHDALPDAIMELVFLGLDSLVCLHRAASACKRWRRIIASDTFRSLHSTLPVVAGSYYNEVDFHIRPRFEPSPSATAVDRRHFSLSFLPGRNHYYCNKWLIKDSHRILLLLVRRDWKTSRDDLIICEPLTQRHEVLPPPPLAPSASYWGTTTVLLAGDDVDCGGGSIATGMSNFKVLCLVQDDRLHGSLHAYLFTSGRGSTWRTSSINNLQSTMTFIGIATGRRYWKGGKKEVFALDQSTLEFSSFVLPDDDDDRNSRTVVYNMVALTVGPDDEARIAVGDGIAGNNNNIKIFARVQCGSDGEKWELEKTVQLSAAMLGLPRLEYFYLFYDLPVQAGKLKILVPALAPGTWFFCLDMETMEVERLPKCDKDYMPDYKKPYPFEFPWPSLLRACRTDDKV